MNVIHLHVSQTHASLPREHGKRGELTWKKLVWEGSRPVLPAGTITSHGATRPTRAGAPTCISCTVSINVLDES